VKVSGHALEYAQTALQLFHHLLVASLHHQFVVMPVVAAKASGWRRPTSHVAMLLTCTLPFEYAVLS
jgi:hypothetical protein